MLTDNSESFPYENYSKQKIRFIMMWFGVCTRTSSYVCTCISDNCRSVRLQILRLYYSKLTACFWMLYFRYWRDHWRRCVTFRLRMAQWYTRAKSTSSRTDCTNLKKLLLTNLHIFHRQKLCRINFFLCCGVTDQKRKKCTCFLHYNNEQVMNWMESPDMCLFTFMELINHLDGH